MDTLYFISDLSGAWAWPIAVVFIAIILRKPIADLINRITSISHNETRIDLIPLVESRATAESAGSLQPGDTEGDGRSHESIAASPRAAIIEAWIRVQTAAEEMIQERDPSLRSLRPRSSGQVINFLRQSGIVDDNVATLLRELMTARNQAAHHMDLNVSVEDARSYVDVAEQVVAALGKERAEHINDRGI